MLGRYKYALVNDILDQAGSELRSIVLTARGENGELRTIADSCLSGEDASRLRPVLDRFK